MVLWELQMTFMDWFYEKIAGLGVLSNFLVGFLFIIFSPIILVIEIIQGIFDDVSYKVIKYDA